MVAAYTQLLADRYRGKLDENADKYIGYAVEGALRMQALIVLKFINVSHIGPRLFRGQSQYRMQTETDQRNSKNRSDRGASCSEQTHQK